MINAKLPRALLRWMYFKGEFRTHDVLQWGLNFKYNRADRQKREFGAQGYIREVDKWEKVMRGYNTRESVYVANREKIKAECNEILYT